MAKTFNFSKTMAQRGTVLFSNIVTQPEFSGKATGKWELTITLDDEQLSDAQANGFGIVEGEYGGQPQYKIKSKTQFKPNKLNVVDGAKQPFVNEDGEIKEIPRGSRVLVFMKHKGYEMMGKEGVANYLQGIQVIESASAGLEFEDFVGEGMDEMMDSEEGSEY